MWFRKLKLKLLAGAYLTVIQLSTGLKYFWAFFFEWPNWKKKSQSFFACFHITNVCQEHCWWHAAPQDRALLSSYTIALSKYRQMSRDCVQADRGCWVLAVVTVLIVSMSATMWVERLSGLTLLHVYRDMSINTDKIVQEFCARKPHSLAFEFWTHVYKPSFGLTF